MTIWASSPLFISAVLMSLLHVTPIQDSKYDYVGADFQEFMYVTKYDYANAHFQEFMYVTT